MYINPGDHVFPWRSPVYKLFPDQLYNVNYAVVQL
jgi:hypothetical protein